MSTSPPPAARVNREAQARAEVGVTAISSATAWLLIAVFFVVILAGSLGQVLIDQWRNHPSVAARIVAVPGHAAPAWRSSASAGGSAWDKLMAGNDAMLAAMQRWEDDLKDDAFFRPALLSQVQSLMLRVGAGNEQAYPGRDGWLFYRPGVEHLCQAPFLDTSRLHRLHLGTRLADPRPAIRAFARDLAARGIRLVLVPVPDKAQVHPDKLSARFPAQARMLRNASELPLFRELAGDGVLIVDLEAPLMAEKDEGRAAYLRTDTHWTPDAMRACALTTARAIREFVPAGLSPVFSASAQAVRNHGDITTMLRLTEDQQQIASEHTSILSVRYDDKPWTASSTAAVLLLGDSFTNIFHIAGMGWGADAGFAEHLSLALGQRIDLISRNGSGAVATRQVLADQVASDPARLATTRIVVWQFAMRELSVGDWKLTPLAAPGATTATTSTRPAQPALPYLDEELTVTTSARIARISAPPGRDLAYQNFVREVELDEVTIPGHTAPLRVLARVVAVERRITKPAAAWHEGQRIRVRLVPFDDALNATWGSEQGTQIEGRDPAMKLATPFWIEEVLP